MRARAKALHEYAFVQVCDWIETHMHVDQDELTGPHRARRLGDARSFAAFVLYELGVPYSRIGYLLLRDHTTIMHCVKRFRRALKDREYWATCALQSFSPKELAPTPESVHT